MTTENDEGEIQLAERIKTLRQARKMTLAQVEDRCGVRASTISKIERGTISPSYSTLLRLAKGLEVDLAEMVEPPKQKAPKTRRIITRSGEGPMHSIGTHDYRFLCSELTQKKMNPMIATVYANEISDLARIGERPDGCSRTKAKR